MQGGDAGAARSFSSVLERAVRASTQGPTNPFGRGCFWRSATANRPSGVVVPGAPTTTPKRRASLPEWYTLATRDEVLTTIRQGVERSCT